MSCDQNAKLNHNIKVGNKFFENAMKFKCWSQLYDWKLEGNPGNSCYYLSRIFCFTIYYLQIQWSKYMFI